MNVSVRADQLHTKALTLDTTSRPLSANADRLVTAETNSWSLGTFALGLGGVLTVLWTGGLLWMGGYLIGFW